MDPETSTSEENVGKANRGLPKSGRWWKDEQKNRHSTIIKSKALKTSWEKKQEERAKKKQLQMLQNEIREKLKQEKQEKIQRAKEQEERRLENEKKAEIVQVIKNTAKLKATKKKQLRSIQKRDVTQS